MGIWTKKSLKQLPEIPENRDKRLKRALGPVDLILLGIGAIVGAGLFSITGIAAAENAGPAIIISFIIAGLGCTFAGLCYCEMAAMIPVAGSAYTYTYAALGQLAAWIVGWSLVLEYALGAATVAISWSAYVLSLLYDFNISFPLQLAVSPWETTQLPGDMLISGWINLPALFIIVVVSLFLILGIRESALVNDVIVFIKITVILVFIGVGIFYIQPKNYVPFIPDNSGVFGQFGWSGILRAAGVIFFAYIGFDSVSTMAQETKDPQKNLPIGILGSLIFCTIIYIIFSFVMTGLVNYKELDVAAPVALAISKTPFFWLDWLIKLAVLAGLTSVILVFLLGQSRVFFAMANDGLLPRCFAALHPKFRTPWYSNLILMGLVGLIASYVPLSILSHMTSIGTLLAFVMVCTGVVVLRYTHPEQHRPFKSPFFPFVPLMGIFTCFLMMVTLDVVTWLRLGVWISIGLFIYYGYGRRYAV